MEGVGSRLGRASSRYGPSTSAPVFNGPVRKWKKKWVHVSQSSTAGNHHAHSNGHNTSSRLLLCKWTPLSPATAAADTPSEEPPRRRIRYTPIVVLEELKKETKRIDQEANTAGTNPQFEPLQTSNSENDELISDSAFKTENQDSSTSNLDLDLCLKGHISENDSNGQSKEKEMKKQSSGGFWTNN